MSENVAGKYKYCKKCDKNVWHTLGEDSHYYCGHCKGFTSTNTPVIKFSNYDGSFNISPN